MDISSQVFLGYSLPPLLSILCMVSLTKILREANASYEWSDRKFKVIHLLFMGDFKMFVEEDAVSLI